MIFLTSSVGSVAGHLHKNFLEDKGFKSILFIDTAAEPKEMTEDGDSWLQKDLRSLQEQGYQVDRYSITGKSREEIKEKFDAYDILYMCGGDTAYLLAQFRATNSFGLIGEMVLNGKPYIGTSAGSIIAGPRLPDYFLDGEESLEDTTCFGFVNFTLIPHWGDDHFKERYVEKRLPLVYKPTQDPLLLLTDKQYVQVNDDGSLRIITT